MTLTDAQQADINQTARSLKTKVSSRNTTAQGLIDHIVSVSDVGAPPPPPPPPSNGASIPTSWKIGGSFENSLTDGVQRWGLNPSSGFVVTRVSGDAAEGNYAAKMECKHNDPTYSYCRIVSFGEFSLGEGDEGWMRGAWKVPDPSKLTNGTRLINLCYYADNATAQEQSLLAVHIGAEAGDHDGMMKVHCCSRPPGQYWPTSQLIPEMPVPANIWFTLWLHFKLSATDGKALTELYMRKGSGAVEKVGSSTKHNLGGPAKPYNLFNAGWSYVYPQSGLVNYFDLPGLTY